MQRWRWGLCTVFSYGDVTLQHSSFIRSNKSKVPGQAETVQHGGHNHGVHNGGMHLKGEGMNEYSANDFKTWGTSYHGPGACAADEVELAVNVPNLIPGQASGMEKCYDISSGVL